MDVWVAAILGAVGGAAVGAAVLWALGAAKTASVRARVQLLDEQGQMFAAEAEALKKDAERERQIAEQERQHRHQAELALKGLNSDLASRERQIAEQRHDLEKAEKKLADTFKAVGADALRHNNAQFLDLARETFEKLMKEAAGDVDKKQQAIDALVKPIRELLDKHGAAVADIETKREAAYARLDEQIKNIATSHDTLRQETGRLVTALRRPEVRGRWGEVQLRTVVEMAGLERHCDFDEQITLWKGDQSQRPDLVVNLPGGGSIPVDAKVTMDAYLGSLQPDADREALIQQHARHVAEQVHRLADKRYWELFDRSPKVVVLFISPESALAAALDVTPTLQHEAMGRHVLIATPTTLVALLRAVAYGWQQEDVAANARAIAATGAEIYDRLSRFAGALETVGDRLNSATSAYNKAVGTLESRLLPSARKIKEMHGTTEDDIRTPPLIDIEARPIIAPELKPPAELSDEVSEIVEDMKMLRERETGDGPVILEPWRQGQQASRLEP